MGEAFARGDKLVFTSGRTAVPIIDSGNDLCPGNVGGHIALLAFHRENVTASLTGAVVPLNGGSAVNPEFVCPRGGSVVGFAVQLSTAATKGSADWWVTKNGTTQAASKLTQTKTSNSRAAYVWINKDSVTFARGSRIGVKFTTNGTWAAGTVDVMISVAIEI